jgi:biopolymer transport protein ExbB
MPTLRKTLLGALCAAAAATAFAAPAYAWQEGWSYRAKVTLTPSQTGATGEIGTQPVLIRLHSGNFAFADAKPDGSDLRFYAGDDRTPLRFQIEKWSPQEEVGLVWVQVPALSAAGPTPIYAYYGNKKAAPAGDAKAVFSGQVVAWHFSEDGAPQDASGNGVTGSAGAGRNPSGLIGQSLKLGGQAGVGLPTSFTLSGAATVSMWVKPAAAGGGGTLFAQPGGLTIGLNGGTPYLAVGGQQAAASVPLAADGWTHLAAVSDGTRTVLYVNGQSAGQVAGPLPAASGQASLGQGFAGEIDEFEATRAALPAGAIQLAAASQGLGSKLAAFDKAEQVESGGHSYFAILFKALTPDAWAVIGLLGIMAAISWVVMVTKGLFLGRVGAANDVFLDAYEMATVGRSDHDGLAELPAEFAKGASSLAHLYRIGQRELAKRLKEGKSSGSRYAIRAQSIAAIRSALDAAQVRESQRLNKWMVLLTIAISGGPFLGLLGTVVGVMITFAAVAAAGDVNINAIAPGIAAALLATVAGLAVAIPALFGYNYLLSRVEEISADDQIFVDELEKRIAETWQDVSAPAPLAAE